MVGVKFAWRKLLIELGIIKTQGKAERESIHALVK